jgi:phosphatidylglycerophosphatase A
MLKKAFKALPRNLIINIATLGPLGNSRLAPGGLGSIAGIVWYTIGFWNISFFQFLLRLLLSNFIGMLICEEAENRIGEKDPSCVILDEFCAMPLCFYGIERFLGQIAIWKILLYGFFVFRFLDVLKPFGIKSLQRFKGGFGIVIDDIAAAILTCIIVHITAPALFA